jgi:hypothetical protein
MSAPLLFANNASSRLFVAADATTTSIRVEAGDGNKFPQPVGDGSNWFMVTVEDRRTSQIEIMKCIGRSSDILNVQRHQEGTAAQSFLLGATVSNRMTAGAMIELSLSGSVTISAAAPTVPGPGQLWWESDSGILYIWYDDGDSTQWVQVNGGVGTPASGGGGGGGGGGDLDSTPVAPVGSTMARTMPEWLAGAPVIEIAADVAISPNHRGCWLHMMNVIGSSIFLPDDWPVGMSFGVRQMGTGPVTWWTTGSDATVQLPFTRNTHTGISEQYEEIIFRVVANSDGGHAVWGISGATG